MLKPSLILPGLVIVAAGLSPAQSASHPATHSKSKSHARAEAPPAPLTDSEKALQMLNRFTFGPRPGDVDAVMRESPNAWLARQLDPASIPNSTMESRLGDYPAPNLTPAQVAVDFPTNQIIKQVAEGKRPYPQDATVAAVYQVLVQKYEDKQREEKAGAPAAPEQGKGDKPALRKQDESAALVIAEQLLGLPKNQRMAALLKLPVDQRIMLTGSVPDPQKSMLIADLTPHEREFFYTMAGGPDAAHVVDSELQQAKVVRAILSERQLQEVMTDFWFNHFNVFINKETDRIYTPDYERNAIRAHALGKFRDLLLATAQHPAMLVYLDNWQSIGPDSPAAERAKQRQNQRGLNENYGREVMELHTVGVDSGYSQQDVTNLSKILTGWTVENPQEGGGFAFDERRHEPGAKQWFGHSVRENGYDEGREALAWLAAQPQTAHFISYKLAQRFLADDPPTELVDRMAKTFLASDGDIKQVLLTMVHLPEFFSRKYYRTKVKTPLEFVASAFRATETNPTNPAAIVNVLQKMGEPLYQMQPPTGYPMTADHWMNSAALVDRLNFSLALSNSKLGNMKFDAPHLLAAGLLARPATEPPSQLRRISMMSSSDTSRSGQDEAVALMEQMLIPGAVSEKTSAVIRNAISSDETQQTPADPSQTLNTVTALVLGSPEFQMR